MVWGPYHWAQDGTGFSAASAAQQVAGRSAGRVGNHGTPTKELVASTLGTVFIKNPVILGGAIWSQGTNFMHFPSQ